MNQNPSAPGLRAGLGGVGGFDIFVFHDEFASNIDLVKKYYDKIDAARQ